MVIYLNGLAFPTIKRDEILIDIGNVYQQLNVAKIYQPEIPLVDKMVNPTENTYVVGPYATIDNTILAINALDDRFISPEKKSAISDFLEEAVNHRWNRQPEFTPLWRWWRPI